ncbi:hypothetical protein [Flammeovirga pacifica]|uniref:Uncharacterized protein n=1 Tax=Flammeovirga pacifica TaxID=915059 RepID=A0A1S1YZI8_FLAPC|nr:hypothetical protein [Flammeovirga pacifica]OHX66434.1 hypothetical protein NH26_08720 [Flammeovirga pacifica]
MKNFKLFIFLLALPLVFTSCFDSDEEDLEGVATFSDVDGVKIYAEWKTGDLSYSESIDEEHLRVVIYHEDDEISSNEFSEEVISDWAEYPLTLSKNLKDGEYTIKIKSGYDTSDRTDYTVFVKGNSISKAAYTKDGYFLAGDSYLEVKSFKIVKNGSKYTVFD